MEDLDFPPTAREVKDQLKRLLAAPRFKKAGNPSDFLALTVKRAMAGMTTRGRIIAKELFAKYVQGVSRDVRVTSNSVRKLLKLYYEREGSDDPVIIYYPEPSKDPTVKPVEGQAYTPLFRYNPKHYTATQIRLAFRSLRQGTWFNDKVAYLTFCTVLEKDQNNIGALLGMVETICYFHARGWEIPSRHDPLLLGNSIIESVQVRGERYWRFWAIKAHLHHTFREAPEVTKACYDHALKLEQLATEAYLPYIRFLIDSGQKDDALGLTKRYADENAEDPTAVAESGALYCYAREYENALPLLRTVLGMDRGNCVAHQAMIVLHFEQRDFEGVARHLNALKFLCDGPSFDRILISVNTRAEQQDLSETLSKLLLTAPSAGAYEIQKP